MSKIPNITLRVPTDTSLPVNNNEEEDLRTESYALHLLARSGSKSSLSSLDEVDENRRYYSESHRSPTPVDDCNYSPGHEQAHKSYSGNDEAQNGYSSGRETQRSFSPGSYRTSRRSSPIHGGSPENRVGSIPDTSYSSGHDRSRNYPINRLPQHLQSEPLPMDSISMIDEEEDLKELREGISYALGGENTTKNWFPLDKEVGKRGSIVGKSAHRGSIVGRSTFKNNNLDVLSLHSKQDYTHDIPLQSINSQNSVQSVLDDLEQGHEPVETKVDPPKSLGGLLTRISDRIAGAGDTLPSPFRKLRDSHVSENNLGDFSLKNLHANHSAASIQSTHRTLGTETSNLESELRPETSEIPRGNPGNALYGHSLFLFSPQSKVRIRCHKILSNPLSNFGLLALLFLQISLLVNRQWNPHALNGYYWYGYNWADYVLVGVNSLYTGEIFAKIIAYGLFDDRVMYEVLGIEYPQDEIGILMGKNYVKQFMGYIFRTSYERLGKGIKDSGDKVRSRINRRREKLKEVGKSVGIRIGNSVGIQVGNNEIEELQRTPSYSSDLDIKEIDLQDIDMTPNIQQKYKNINLNFTPHDPPKAYGVKPILRHKNTLLLSEPTQKMELNRAYLRNSWHKIDFFSMIFFWISFAILLNHYDAEHHIMIFRALSCLRILRLLNLTTGTTTILTSCRLAIPQLIDVSIFISFFWIFFGIIGVQSFKSSLTRHCVWTNPDDPTDTYVNSELYCGSSLHANGTAMPYLFRDGTSSNIVKGFRCPVNSQCISGDNPFGGTVNFDNILQSMEMVFVVISANTFTDIMYDTMDSDNLAACLFFIFGIFTLTVWLVNVSIAVIIASFHLSVREGAIEKKKPKRYHLLGRLFETFSQEDSMNKDRIEQLKKQNLYLKMYYRFEFVWAVVVLADLFVQCFRRADMTEDRRHLLYRFEVAFTLTFLIEIIARFFFHLPKWRLFFGSKRNVFDLLLAIITGIIIIQPVKDALGHTYYWLTVFQIMRFYRVVLATPFTRKLWLKIMKDSKAIFDLVLFYFILTFLWSIIMARYFEGTIPEDSWDDVDFPMHTLPNAFVALYIITSTENWTDILYHLQEFATTTSSRSFGSVLLIAWFIISNMVVLNFFTAVIARSLEVSEEGKRKKQLLQFIENLSERFHAIETGTSALSRFKSKVFSSSQAKEEMEKAIVNLLLSGTAVNEFLEENDNTDDEDDDDDIPFELQGATWKRWLHFNYWKTNNFDKNPFYRPLPKKLDISNFDPALFAKSIINERKLLINRQNKFLNDNPNYNNVFYIMKPQHKIRRFCQKVVKSSYGERIDGVEPYKPVSESFVVAMFIATIALVVTACYLTPLYRRDMFAIYGYYSWTFYLELAFVALFSVEFVIKILADGFIFTPNAYIRSSWNIIDLIVFISLWIEFIAFIKNNGALSRVVRGLKALRALRILTISETAKNNFHNTMISGFWKILSAAMISLCLLFPFSIWGLNIFNGRLGSCVDGTSDLANCFNEYQNGVFNWDIMSPNVYQEPQLEFNRFATSFVSLFEIVSLEGWTDLLMDLMNSTGIGTPPQKFATPVNGFFLILFNLIGVIFILTLFVSVVINNYSKTTGRAYMTREQVSWYQVKKILLQIRPSKRKDSTQLSWLSKLGYRLTVEKDLTWGRLTLLVLFLHVVALLLETFPQKDVLFQVRFGVFVFTSSFFIVNSVLLFFGQGYRTFIRYKWNWFNLIVLIGSFITTLIGYFIDQNSVFININKLYLVAMLAFVIPRSNRLSQLLRFASAGLSSLLLLLFTWIVVFMVFAIAMNQIFGMTKVGPNGTGNINLRSVPKALILLFRCSFGEGWNNIMADYTLEEPFCTTNSSTDESDTDCGSKQYAYILFISWNIISMYIFLNMFVSLILDSFSYIKHKSAYSKLMEREETRKFKRVWQTFDPEGTGFIKPIQLPALLHSLEGELLIHLYHGELEIPVLCKKWFTRKSTDPYDIEVNFGEIEETWSEMNVPKIRERRYAYEMFIEEALMTMELNNEPGISFTRILLQIPLYNSFEPGQCLNLTNFLERRLLVQKVMRRMHVKRVHETMTAYACRWKYRKDQRLGIRDSNIAFDTQLNRNSYLSNESFHPSKSYYDESLSNTVSNESFHPSIFVEKPKDEDYLYEPNSPLNVYKGTTRSLSGNHLDVGKRILFDDNSSSTNSINDEGGSSPFIESKVSMLDISTLGDLGATLGDSFWGDALREVQSARSRSKSPRKSNDKEGDEDGNSERSRSKSPRRPMGG